MQPKSTVFILVILTAVLFSCAGKRDYSDMSAKQMYDRAEEMASGDKGMFSRNSMEEPLEMLKELQIRHTFSPYSSLAALKTADIYFGQEKYKTAADQYRKFISDNPRHGRLEHAMYRLSESFYRIRESRKRDQLPCRQTIYWYRAFLSYYPDSRHRGEAISKIDTCVNLLSENELEIGKFYLKRKHYEAARRRFLYIADKFPHTEAAIKSAALMKSIPPEEEDSE